jgi:hypothetical protein
MAQTDRQTVVDAAVDAKCEEFTELATKIWQAGLCWPGESPFANALNDFLPGDNGALWPQRPSEMSPAAAFAYIEHRFGLLFAGFAKTKSQFTVH